MGIWKNNKLFLMIKDEFAPNSEVTTRVNRTGNEYFVAINGEWLAEYRAYREEAGVPFKVPYKLRLNEKIVFEAEEKNNLVVMCTQGQYLMHLDLPDEIYSRIQSTLTYHERYEQKHCFAVTYEQLPIVLKSYHYFDESLDNGLIKEGEILNSAKHRNGRINKNVIVYKKINS